MPPNRFAQPMWLPHGLLLLSLIFAGAFVAWSRATVLDEVARGVGKVIPARQVQVVQNLEGGILTELLVREGEQVTAGQPLLRIDDTRFSADFRESEHRIVVLRARIARLDSELAGDETFTPPEALVAREPDLTRREQELFAARATERAQTDQRLQSLIRQRRHALAELRARRDQVARGASLARKELAITRPLVKQGVMSEVELLRLQRQVNELEGEQQTLRAGIPRAEAELAEAEQQREEWQSQLRSRSLAERNEAATRLAELREKRPPLADRMRRATVRAPVAGTIKRIHVTTVGGVIQPGMDLMTLVPGNDTLLIEAHIAPADIAFLHPGQAAVVKFSAYDYALYGGLPARLEHISADSLTNERGETFYLVRLSMPEAVWRQKSGAALPILPGMTVSVDVITGARTVWAYLVTPLAAMRARALRER